jgi:hypothetical protein
MCLNATIHDGKKPLHNGCDCGKDRKNNEIKVLSFYIMTIMPLVTNWIRRHGPNLGPSFIMGLLKDPHACCLTFFHPIVFFF